MIFIYDFSPCGLNLVIGQVPIKKWASRVKTNIGGFCTCDSICNIIVILSVRLQLETRRDLIFPFIHASAFEINLSSRQRKFFLSIKKKFWVFQPTSPLSPSIVFLLYILPPCSADLFLIMYLYGSNMNSLLLRCLNWHLSKDWHNVT